MASVFARLPSPPLMVANGRQPTFGPLQKLAMPTIKERQDRFGMIAKSTSESSESSVVESVRNIWENPADRLALIGLGFTGVVALWVAINFVMAIDKIPIVPSSLQLIGLLFVTWFTYRFLLFKPDRQELSQKVSKSISDILGQ